MFMPFRSPRRPQRRGLTILLSAACAIVCGAVALPAHAQDPSYTVTVVGNIDSYAYGLNNSGTVVGFAYGPASNYHAFVNTGAGPRDLGTLGGANSVALDVNDAGQIVGAADTANGQSRAFSYQSGVMTNLGTFGGEYSAAFGINAAGSIVGTAAPVPSTDPEAYTGLRAFVQPPGGHLQDLGTLPFPYPFATALDINNRGQIVGVSGQSGPGDPPAHPFLYENGVMTDLGTFGGPYATANAINDRGQIVGYSDVPSGLHFAHAFLYENGALVDLDAILGGGDYSIANDINNRGEIVGSSAGMGAFILHNGKAQRLSTLIDPASGWQVDDAEAINERGQIAATATLDGHNYAVLLTPVPEPAAVHMLVIGLGLAGIVRVARGRKAIAASVA